jgi:hypothetical protein
LSGFPEIFWFLFVHRADDVASELRWFHVAPDLMQLMTTVVTTCQYNWDTLVGVCDKSTTVTPLFMEVHAQGMPPVTDHNESLPFKEKMGATLGKRKSPMELRLEQLKRHQTTHEVGAHEISRAQGSFSNKKEVGCPQRPLDDIEVPNINPSVKPAESFQFYPLRNKKDNLPIIRNEATCNQNATSEDPSSSISWSVLIP